MCEFSDNLDGFPPSGTDLIITSDRGGVLLIPKRFLVVSGTFVNTLTGCINDLTVRPTSVSNKKRE